MHKSSIKFWFIIGARNCITKQVAKKFVKILLLWRYTGDTATRSSSIQESKYFGLLKIMLKFWKTSNLSTLNEMQGTFRWSEREAQGNRWQSFQRRTQQIHPNNMQDGSTARRIKVLPRKISSAWSTWLLIIHFYTPVFRRDVLWYGAVRPSVCPSVRPFVRPSGC